MLITKLTLLTKGTSEEPPGKRKRLDLMGEWVAGEDNQADGQIKEKPKEKKDEDEDFYGTAEEKVRAIARFIYLSSFTYGA